MNCKKCGEELQAEAKFCKKCGAKVEENDKGVKNKKILIILIIVFIIIILGIIGFIIFNKETSNVDSKETSTIDSKEKIDTTEITEENNNNQDSDSNSNTTSSGCPSNITNLSSNDLISEYRYETTKTGEEFGEKYEFECYIDISLYKDNLAYIDSNCTPGASGEKRFANYEINYNTLYLTRLDYSITDYDGSCVKYSFDNKKETFIINSDGSLSTNVYNGESSTYTIAENSQIILNKIK